MKEILTRTDPINEVPAETGENTLMRTRLLSRTVTEIFDSKLRPFGISATQFALLEAIDRTEPATRASIARNQQLDKSTLTRNLKSIFSHGWVEEVRETADGRSRPIVLTKVGKQLLLDAASSWLGAQTKVRALLGQQGLLAVTSSADRIAVPSGIPAPSAEIKKENGR